MAFLNEVIPEEFKRRFDFSVFRDPLNRPFEFPDWDGQRWAIDRLRNAFLICTGGASGAVVDCPRIEWYGLWWDGNVATFSADKSLAEHEMGYVLIWAKPRLQLADHLEEFRDEFIEVLKEALQAYGLNGDASAVYAVRVDF